MYLSKTILACFGVVTTAALIFLGLVWFGPYSAPHSNYVGAHPSKRPAVVPSSHSEEDESALPLPLGSVAMEQSGGVYTVPVRINGALTLKFLIDSGASDVSIPADVFQTLVRTKTVDQSDYIGTKTYTLADGSKAPSQTFRIRELRVGSFVLRDVVASISDRQGPLLLGQSFLSRFRSWSLDNSQHMLLLQPMSPDQVVEGASTSPEIPEPSSPGQAVDSGGSSVQPAAPTDTGGSGSEALALQRVRDFWSNLAAEHDTDGFYADQASYNGSISSRADFSLGARQLAEQWPQRSFRIREDTLSANCDTSGCEVKGFLDYDHSNAELQRRRVGSMRFLLRFDAETPGRIVEENLITITDEIHGSVPSDTPQQ